MSEQDPGPTHTPYGQPTPSGSGQSPYGQSPYGQQPYGQQPYGQQPYGAADPDRRPTTVTAAAWIAMVFSGLTAALFAVIALVFVVARDEFVTAFDNEMQSSMGTGDIDAESLAGAIVAVFLVFAVWSAIAVVLGVFVLRRSNVARILLVISSVVAALLSLLTITSVLSAVWLIACVATIVMLFVGGAGDWFAGRSAATAQGGYGGHDGGYGSGYGTSSTPYGGQQANPYGSQPDAPTYPAPSENPYGQPPAGGSDQPPSSDYPNR